MNIESTGRSPRMRTALLAGLAFLALAAPAAAQTDARCGADDRRRRGRHRDADAGHRGVRGDTASQTASTSSAARRAANRVAGRSAARDHAPASPPRDIRTLGCLRPRSGSSGSADPDRVRRAAGHRDQGRPRRDQVGALIDAASEAGAEDIEGPEFGFCDPSRGACSRPRAAIADARKRADDAAAQTGLRIIGVRSVVLAPGRRGVRRARLPAPSADSAERLASGADERLPGHARLRRAGARGVHRRAALGFGGWTTKSSSPASTSRCSTGPRRRRATSSPTSKRSPTS